MNATAATDIITTAKADELEVTVRLIDGTEITGDPISVNSKGVNLKVDGKVRSFGLSRVASILTDEDVEAEAEATDRMEEIVNEISDGATTAEIADHLTTYLEREVTPKELRVHLRALGLGVGKGRKYALSSGEFRAVVNILNSETVTV